MITIIKFKQVYQFNPHVENIDSWITAVDIHDARRQAHLIGNNNLANELYRFEIEPKPGKYHLGQDLVMLVS